MKKKALVTGANKGIGFGICRHLGLSNWEIIIGARDEERATKAAERLGEEGISVAGWVNIELTDNDSIERAARTVREKYPDLALLVNNAGIPGDMSVASYDTEMSDIKATMNVNFYGTFALTKALLPIIESNKGRIVNITVPHEISPYWHPLAYVASKAAQNAMTAIMATDLTAHGMATETYSIHPGPTTTDLNGNMALEGFHSPDTVGMKVAEIINDGKSHQGEFIELYPIVPE